MNRPVIAGGKEFRCYVYSVI